VLACYGPGQCPVRLLLARRWRPWFPVCPGTDLARICSGEPLLAKYAQVVENRLSPGRQVFTLSLSGRLCRSPLWSGVVVRLMPRKQERCQAKVDRSSATGLGALPASVAWMARCLRLAMIWGSDLRKPGLSVLLDSLPTLVNPTVDEYACQYRSLTDDHRKASQGMACEDGTSSDANYR
jgi:hypothetical protein